MFLVTMVPKRQLKFMKTWFSTRSLLVNYGTFRNLSYLIHFMLLMLLDVNFMYGSEITEIKFMNT